MPPAHKIDLDDLDQEDVETIKSLQQRYPKKFQFFPSPAAPYWPVTYKNPTVEQILSNVNAKEGFLGSLLPIGTYFYIRTLPTSQRKFTRLALFITVINGGLLAGLMAEQRLKGITPPEGTF